MGNSKEYQYNAECPDGPYLADGENLSDADYGTEIWCGLTGRYVSLVRNFTDFPYMESVSICDFPIFGDLVVETATVLTDTIVINLGIEEIVFQDFDYADYVTSAIPEVLIRVNEDTRPTDIDIVETLNPELTSIRVLVMNKSLAF